MKILRNPVFTAGLVIVAIAVIFYQLGSPRQRLGRLLNAAAPVQSPVLTPVTMATPPPPQPRTPTKQASKPGSPGPGIDREYAELHFDGWVEWPQRDPFLLLTPDPDEQPVNVDTNSPVTSWKLRAIWAQTGSRLAVINRGAYREGDEIEGYKIDKIDTGGVWFIGPHDRERERLGFDTRPKPPATNAPAAAPKQ